MKKGTRKERLERFADKVLFFLNRDEDWGSDTTTDIGNAAVELGLAEISKRGKFAVLPKGRRKK